MQTEQPKKAETKPHKPVNYSVSYSTASTYKDGIRDVKEHVEVKNPELNLVADRLPGKEEFDVKIQKEGDKEPKHERVPANQLRNEIDKVYHDIQSDTRDEFFRLGLPFGRTSGSLFGSTDLPMLGHASNLLPIEPEGGSLLEPDNRTLATRPVGTDFFVHEMRNIEREMDYMRRRMEDEMSRFW